MVKLSRKWPGLNELHSVIVPQCGSKDLGDKGGSFQAKAGWDAPFLRQDKLKRTPTTARWCQELWGSRDRLQGLGD
jgi:hypothetical protein